MCTLPRRAANLASPGDWLASGWKRPSDVALQALHERGFENAVDAPRVAEERVGMDAVVVHVVEPVDAARHHDARRSLGVREEEAFVPARVERDGLRDLERLARLGVAV